MQWHRDNFTIDTDRDRLDFSVIVRDLQTTYWASKRSAETIERAWSNSILVFGLYRDDELIGFARVVSDLVAIAYLADVYLQAEARGGGLGTWLVETATSHPEVKDLKWLLHTLDAHELYRKIGFTEPSPRVLERLLTPNSI